MDGNCVGTWILHDLFLIQGTSLKLVNVTLGGNGEPDPESCT